jgi:cysteine desulfurase
MRNRILTEIPDTKLNGPEFPRAYNNVNICFGGNLRGEELMILLDIAHVQCSTGSACNTFSGSPSYVLQAIGLNNDQANSSLRFSLSHENTKAEIDYAVDRLKELVERIRS